MGCLWVAGTWVWPPDGGHGVLPTRPSVTGFSIANKFDTNWSTFPASPGSATRVTQRFRGTTEWGCDLCLESQDD